MPRDCHQTQSWQTEGAERTVARVRPETPDGISAAGGGDAGDHDVDAAPETFAVRRTYSATRRCTTAPISGAREPQPTAT